MNLRLIKNPDETKKLSYQIARVVYAETSASSLTAVEALVSMINNSSRVTGRSFAQIISDTDMFESLNETSVRHEMLSVPPLSRGFQMRLRVVGRMLMVCRICVVAQHDFITAMQIQIGRVHVDIYWMLMNCCFIYRWKQKMNRFYKGGFLSGYRTYIMSSVGILSAIAAYVVGDSDIFITL